MRPDPGTTPGTSLTLALAAEERRAPDPPDSKALLLLLLRQPHQTAPLLTTGPSPLPLQEPRPHWLLHCGPAVLPGDWPAGRRHGSLRRRECGAWDQGEWSFSLKGLGSAPTRVMSLGWRNGV